ncbi:MAG TPA: 5'/3'-nucleotidase SurE [Hyphomicrobiales bacterium]|nr:5'/3'-nucleotidase SurE [Hyphomicrobiales bacterium]
MRILITNDDGIEAPGLDALQKIASDLSDEVWVVAPETDQSGAAHSLTLHEPLRLRKLSERVFAVKGTPTDCVIMGVRYVLRGREPDLVLSGVNRGSNLADDITYSGTIAGAIEGTLLGIPSIAMSLAVNWEDPKKIHWETPMQLGADLVRKLMKAGWPRDVLLNINFPDREASRIHAIEITEQGRRDQDYLRIEDRLDTRGNPYYWLGFKPRSLHPPKGTDLWAIRSGAISVTPLFLNLTHKETCQKLATAFEAASP